MLITTPAQFADWVLIDKGVNIEALRTHIRNAERTYIKPALGTTLYAALDAYGGSGNATFDALLLKVREPLALLAMNTLVRDVSVMVGDTGASVHWSDNYRPALAEQITNKLDALQVCGMSALDALYDHLQSANPSSWRTSAAGILAGGTLLRTAEEFTAGFPINGSRTTFMDLRPAMLRAQDFDIAPAIGATFLETLLTHVRTAGSNDNYDTAIAKLKPALAQLAISRADDVVLQFVNGGLVSTRWVAPSSGQNAQHASTGGPLRVVSSMKVNAGTNGLALLSAAQKWMDDNASDLDGYTARTNASDLPTTEDKFYDGENVSSF